MPETLSVHLNREEPRDVAPEAASLETDRSFVLAFRNHGGPTHAHLHLDDALAAVARPSTTQVYVDEGETQRVEIALAADRDPTKGYVDISTGYGAEEARVNVTVTDRRKDGGPEVAVDDSLSEKQVDETGDASSPTRDATPLAVAALVVVLAAALAVAVSDSLALIVGGLAVVVGVAAAIYLLYAGS